MKTFNLYSPTRERRKGSILIVHGSGEHIGRYRWAIDRWNEAGYDVFGGDLPGHGRSDGKKGHIDRFEDYLDAVETWRNELTRHDPAPPYMFGHSLGGLVVVRLLETRRVREPRGVILSSPCFGLKLKVPLWKRALAKTLNALSPSLTFPSNVQPRLVTRNEEVIRRDETDSYLNKRVSVRWYCELLTHMRLNWRDLDRFPNVPLLVYQAGDDHITDQEEARKWFERSPSQQKSYREWSGLYHEILNEPERVQVMKEMIAWMKQIEGDF